MLQLQACKIHVRKQCVPQVTMGLVEELVRHPDEMPALIRMSWAAARAAHEMPSDPHLAYCYQILFRVSHSFAFVIQQLSHELRDAVCVFYVVLRALDTVEDDMSISVETKTPILETFHEHLQDPSWRFVCGERHYRELMENFRHVSLAFLQLSEEYQRVIRHITKRMGCGMAEFICKEVETTADYDKYCYYVAGLVGIGLSALINISGLERLDGQMIEAEATNSALESPSISVGRFLQKVNIIRDYLEDINELPAPRMFWPREIWGKYAPNSVLADFKEEENEKEAVECLNDMITDCLRHAPECLNLMAELRDPSVLRCCAVPQIMAIATAALCYNNPQVFKGVVKVRRGIAAKVMVGTRSMPDVCGAFHDFTSMLASKINRNDPSAAVTVERVEAIYKACRVHGLQPNRQIYTTKSDIGRTVHKDSKVMLALLVVFLAMLLLALLSIFRWSGMKLQV